MAVADRVAAAIDALQRGKRIDALIQVSIAIDATAKREYPSKKKVGERCKVFLRDNQAFISRAATGLLEIQGDIRYTWPDDPKGFKTQEEVLYHLVRCGLLHEGELPDQVQIVDENLVGMTGDGKVLLSVGTIWAMILAVVGASSNSRERLPQGHIVGIGQTKMDLNTLWGRREEMHTMLREHNRPKPGPG